jgi:hypothetical protein
MKDVSGMTKVPTLQGCGSRKKEKEKQKFYFSFLKD